MSRCSGCCWIVGPPEQGVVFSHKGVAENFLFCRNQEPLIHYDF